MQQVDAERCQVGRDTPVPRESAPLRVEVCERFAEPQTRQACQLLIDRAGISGALHCDPRWPGVLSEGLRHTPYLLLARRGEDPVGFLPLALVESWLFGRFLVSLPFVNTAGVVADDQAAATALIDRAVELADRLDVRHLELRHEQPIEHAALGTRLTSKVHMRLALPGSSDELWDTLKAKVRNQVRKGEKCGLAPGFGGLELLDDFYGVFARNMRDLGTPVFSRRLFRAILAEFAGAAELCVVRRNKRAVAGALLVHGHGVTEVPSASSLRRFNWTNANMLMYWHLLRRAVERGQDVFDFGRSSPNSSTFRFKRQWGARPEPAVWQYYVRKGSAGEMRIESGKYDRMIALWQRLPVWLTRLVGPAIVRGIP
jgi:FemAB-related protein (PEP-CTERM system-associated)